MELKVVVMKLVPQISEKGRGNPDAARLAFTLIELLIVMGLMMILMVAGMASYRGIRRGAELRGAESVVRTTLMLARQQAVTRRQEVQVSFLKDGVTNSLRIFAKNGMVHTEAFLPTAVEFINPPAAIVFKPTGSAGVQGAVQIILREKTGLGSILGSVTNTLWPLTGITQ